MSKEQNAVKKYQEDLKKNGTFRNLKCNWILKAFNGLNRLNPVEERFDNLQIDLEKKPKIWKHENDI